MRANGEFMNLDNPIRMVRELKGAPISILFALTVVQTRVSQAWLERTTGYTDKTISQALGYLEEIGLADHTSAGWQLTGEAKQLPLPMENLEPPRHEGHEGHEENQENKSDDSCQGRRISDPGIIIINQDPQEEELSNNNNNKGGRKNSDSDVFGALTKAKIVGKKRKSLSECAWVTVESVENWEAHLKREMGSNYRSGILIRMLESGEAAPKDEKTDYISGLIKAGLYCEFCRQPVQDCECEVEE